MLAPGAPAEDGLLQPREAAALGLDGTVVVLATCQSASGTVLQGEGALSLAALAPAGTAATAATADSPGCPDDEPCVTVRHSLEEILDLIPRQQQERGLELARFDALVTPAASVWVAGWEQSDVPHHLEVDLDWGTFRFRHRRLAEQGDELVELKVYEVEGRQRLAAIWRPRSPDNPTPARIRRGHDWTQIEQIDRRLRNKGFYLSEIEAYPRPDGPDDRWAGGVWRAGTVETRLLTGYPCDQHHDAATGEVQTDLADPADPNRQDAVTSQVISRCPLLLQLETQAREGIQAADFENCTEDGEERWAVLLHKRSGTDWLQAETDPPGLEDEITWLAVYTAGDDGSLVRHATLGYGANAGVEVVGYGIAHRAIIESPDEVRFQIVTPVITRGGTLRLVIWEVDGQTLALRGVRDSGIWGFSSPDDLVEAAHVDGPLFAIAHRSETGFLSSTFWDVDLDRRPAPGRRRHLRPDAPRERPCLRADDRGGSRSSRRWRVRHRDPERARRRSRDSGLGAVAARSLVAGVRRLPDRRQPAGPSLRTWGRAHGTEPAERRRRSGRQLGSQGPPPADGRAVGRGRSRTLPSASPVSPSR